MSVAAATADLMNEEDTSKSLAWLHCNECHRGFEHHNRIHMNNTTDSSTHAVRIVKSDLKFGFTSCGHFFCDNCFKQHSAGGQFICPFCKEAAAEYKLDSVVPKKLEMYIRPPLGLLEDALSVMMLTNANQLIMSLRAKVSQQKDLLSRAKQELAGITSLKGRIAELEGSLARERQADPQSFKPAHAPASPMIKIGAAGPRISLRSPSAFSFSKAPSPAVMSMEYMQQPVMYPPQSRPPMYYQQQPPPQELSPRSSIQGGWTDVMPQMMVAQPYYPQPASHSQHHGHGHSQPQQQFFQGQPPPRPVLRRRPHH